MSFFSLDLKVTSEDREKRRLIRYLYLADDPLQLFSMVVPMRSLLGASMLGM